MLWIMRLSWFFFAAMVMVVFSPSLHSFPPAEAIRSSNLRFSSQITAVDSLNRLSFRKATAFRNAEECSSNDRKILGKTDVCDPSLVHVAITLDVEYLRGSIAAVHSILRHSLCSENIFFHFLVSETNLETLVRSTFPQLKFKVYYFDPEIVRSLISTSVRQALEQPLNYARNYLADLLETCVRRVIYLDSDLVVVDDIWKLWSTSLGGKTIGAPEYCHANFSKYFTASFWSDNRFSGTFAGRSPCYFNTGVMVMDLEKWRRFGYTKRIERWMQIQKSGRIYELGSLPPFLLVFAGHVAAIEHRWNQHGLGGDNLRGSCRDLHAGPSSTISESSGVQAWEVRPSELRSTVTPTSASITASFWSDNRFSGTFAGQSPCYFNTGVMVMDLEKWRRFGYTKRIERWMQIQKSGRIYELGSLPPFLLVFAGHVAAIEHRWNQHGLGGDNLRGSCRDLHAGPVSLLHWSGSGKPWLRLDSKQSCPLDSLWLPYDLYEHSP
ncbi:hypothetical protein TEA_008387 [Camellia sinensis var. sinensis]|uniref:Hexosyltransferase n=1 Tax=Camellia sinensis var. sinensis TaxID=542762 RepID=A0A4S4ES62_CAMSN|nr:hypothetical protein TEA_008387 [Camellia sinensis var. sinensis]